MKTNGSHSKRAIMAGVVIGRARFPTICAVEGITLTDEIPLNVADGTSICGGG